MLSALRNGSSILDAINSAFSDSDLNEEHLAMKTQEYFAHAAQLGWFCRAPFELTGNSNNPST
jgi:hypothetical protein